MANEQNLKKYGKDKPPLTHEQAVKQGKKGGQASGQARATAKTSREIIEMLDTLSVTGKNKDKLDLLGIPADEQTQQTLRLVALHQRAVAGDVQANKLLLEIKGEAPTTTLNVEVNTSAQEAYEKAAKAIKSNCGTGQSK